MPNSIKLKLPSLAFGLDRANVDLDLLQMQQRVSSMTNWTSEFDQLGKTDHFHHKTSVFSSNHVQMIAVASTPTVMKVSAPDLTLAIPLQGYFQTWVGRKEFILNDPSQVMFYPGGRRHTESGIKSVLLINIGRKRLLESARIMLGERGLQQMDLDTPRVLHTKHANVNLLRVILQTCSLVDQFDGSVELLGNFTPDESIVRSAVMMLAPSLLFNHAERVPSIGDAKGRQLVHLREYINANLDQPLSLTTLEAVSGLSARVLQKEFRKVHDCTPMQWVREQRLVRARSIFRMPSASTTVSNVAAQCGFDNFSDFARRYRLLFQELPSETLRKALLSQ